MVTIDYVVLVLYALGLLGVGAFFAMRIRDAKDMFAAGGRSPWWMSGLSAFMTMFSAGTFVVWGGIAYRYGLVAVSISLCYGVAALAVGWTIAGYWRRLGVNSAAEFLQLRFGQSLVQFYTWFQGTVLMFTLGGTIYAVAVIVCALVPLPEGHFLADPDTGNLSVLYASIAIWFGVVLVTFAGGLWAVLMTDVLQFIVLSVSVVFVVPLMFWKLGGVGEFVRQAEPQGLLSPTAGDFTWWFLLGWVVVHYFKIGGEWGFVQRFTCVPSPRDARRSAILFGVMYLVSPLFWMLPAMIYRVMQPIPEGLDEAAINDLSERAYINACQLVLPAGMVGLMVAAMISATASMATTMLNVYAGALTTEVYQRLLRPVAGDKELVAAGRVCTVLVGFIVLAGTYFIPRMGTYTNYILAITAMLTGPLVLPTIWGMFSRRLSLAGAWTATIVGASAAFLVRFGFAEDGWFDGVEWLASLAHLVQLNMKVTDLVIGTASSTLVLLVYELAARQVAPGWQRVQVCKQEYAELPPVTPSPLPAKISAFAVIGIGVMIGVIGLINHRDLAVSATFGGLLILVGATILYFASRLARKRGASPTAEVASAEDSSS